MSGRKVASASILPALAWAVLSLLVAVRDASAGAPLKGVDVKLGKNGGGGAAARTTTDGEGRFKLPVVPAGTYILTFELPPPAKTAEPGAAARQGAVPAAQVAAIEIDGGAGGKATVTWDFARQAPYDPAPADASARAVRAAGISVQSNGRDPLSGICEGAVVKSRSNMANN